MAMKVQTLVLASFVFIMPILRVPCRIFSSYGKITSNTDFLVFESSLIRYCWEYNSYVAGYSCSCLPDCQLYGDCCMGCRHRPVTSDAALWDIVARSRCYGEKRVEKGQHCWVVSQCPANWTDEVVRSKCENPQEHLLTEQIPVSGYDSLNYRNIYCAKCNGANGKPWTLSVDVSSCNILKLLSEERDQNKFISLLQKSGCKMLFRVPESYTYRRCFPGMTMPFQCDPTNRGGGLSLHPDFDLEICHTLFEPILLNGTWYANEYCFSCLNGLEDLLAIVPSSTICEETKCLTDGSTVEEGLVCARKYDRSVTLLFPGGNSLCPEGSCLMCLPGNSVNQRNKECINPIEKYHGVQLITRSITCKNQSALEDLISMTNHRAGLGIGVVQWHFDVGNGSHAVLYYLQVNNTAKPSQWEGGMNLGECTIMTNSGTALSGFVVLLAIAVSVN